MHWILPKTKRKKDESLLSYILRSRGIKDIKNFLSPSEDHIHDFKLLYGAEKAAKEILKAVEGNKKIFIHGDFDVDGICATSIMWDYLYRKVGADVLPYIPSRFDEGYGLSDESIQSIIDQGGDLIITVDCGVKDIEMVEKYKDKIDFIITDHHTLLEADEEQVLGNRLVNDERPSVNEVNGKKVNSQQLTVNEEYISENDKFKVVGQHLVSSSALAVVHPKLNNSYPFTEICGANVAWKVCCMVDYLLRSQNENVTGHLSPVTIERSPFLTAGRQAGQKLQGHDMKDYLDLVALATVCDVMPLIDENRAIVSLGIEKLRNTKNFGLQALAEVSGLDLNLVKSFNLGFTLGPRLNASGRVGHALDAVRLLTTQNNANAADLAAKLNGLNIKRQDLTKNYYEKALEQIEEQGDQNVYFVHGEGWPEGILGLIAGKLTHKLNKPVLVGSKIDDDYLKGSARSPEEVHIANIFKELDSDLERHGGHAQAAGFTLLYSALDTFKNNLINKIDEICKDVDLAKKILIDAELQSDDLDLEIADELMNLEPFGSKNNEPVVAISNIKIGNISRIGREKQHVKWISDSNNIFLECIAFNSPTLLDSVDVSKPIQLAGRLGINEWNGNRKLQMIVVDVKQ